MAKTDTTTKKSKPSQVDEKQIPVDKQQDAPAMIVPPTTFTITLAWDAVKPVYEKQLRKLATRVRMDGFRKGKVPPTLAKQTVGEERAIEQTLEEIVPAEYVREVQERKLQPVGQPEFHPEQVEAGKDWQLHVHISEKPVIALGDWKKIAKKAKEVAVKEFEKAEQEHKVAEEKAQGADKEQKLAEKRDSEVIGKIYAALVTTLRPAMPELLVKQEASAQLRQLGDQLQRFNLKFEDFLSRQNLTQEQLTTQVTGEALGRLQLAFIIDALITDQKLQPSDDEVAVELKGKSAEIQQHYDKNPEALTSLKNRLAQQKAERLLLDL